MTESVLVERVGDSFLLTYETPQDDEFGPVKPRMLPCTEDWLHSALCSLGYLRVGPVEGDVICGLYVRKVR